MIVSYELDVLKGKEKGVTKASAITTTASLSIRIGGCLQAYVPIAPTGGYDLPPLFGPVFRVLRWSNPEVDLLRGRVRELSPSAVFLLTLQLQLVFGMVSHPQAGQ